MDPQANFALLFVSSVDFSGIKGSLVYGSVTNFSSFIFSLEVEVLLKNVVILLASTLGFFAGFFRGLSLSI